MIAQVYDLGTGFKGAVLYLLHGHLDNLDPDRVDWIETRNLPTDDPLAAARIMAATARDRRTKQKPVYHFSISFDYDDPADRALMLHVADRLLADLKMQGYQVIMIAHRDRAHAHLHLVVNRIHPEELTVWSNWKDYWRIERSLRAQEAELGLRIVPGRHALVFDDAGNRLKPAQLVRGDARFLERVRAEAVPHLASARSWSELERELAEHGLRVRMKGRGMVVTDGKHEVKASELDRAFSRSRLEARLGLHGEYRLRLQMATRTLAEHTTRVEQAVGTVMPDPSAPAARIPHVLGVGALDPAFADSITSAQQGEGAASDPGGQAAAPDSIVVGTPVWTQYRGRVSIVGEAGASLSAPEAVSPERVHHETIGMESLLADEPAPLPGGTASEDAETFLQMVESLQQREVVLNEVRKIDETRERIREWSRGLERTSTDVKGATHDFAKEILTAFRDPRAFNDMFKKLTEDQRRAALETLRARPAEFARELLVASGHKAARMDKRSHGWRAMLANHAKSLRGSTAEQQRVFREPGERANVLAAAAGDWYLDAVAVRDSVRRNVAQALGLAAEVTLTEVREALSIRLAAADAQKAELLSLRKALHIPTVKQLEGAFLDLRPKDRQRVMNSIPALRRLIPKALHLADQFVRGRERRSRGMDW